MAALNSKDVMLRLHQQKKRAKKLARKAEKQSPDKSKETLSEPKTT